MKILGGLKRTWFEGALLLASTLFSLSVVHAEETRKPLDADEVFAALDRQYPELANPSSACVGELVQHVPATSTDLSLTDSPVIFRELIQAGVLFRFVAVYSDLKTWETANGKSMNSLLIDSNQRLTTEQSPWFSLAEHSFKRLEQGMHPDSTTKFFRKLRSNPTALKQFLTFYAALFREYVIKVKGTSDSIESEFKRELNPQKKISLTQVNKRLLAITSGAIGAGVIAAFHYFGAPVGWTPDLIWMAAAAPAAAMIPSFYRGARQLPNVLLPSRYLALLQGPQLAHELLEIFEPQLKDGFEPTSYWGLQSTSGNLLVASTVPAIDIKTYEPRFTQFAGADADLRGIVNAFQTQSQIQLEENKTIHEGLKHVLAEIETIRALLKSKEKAPELERKTVVLNGTQLVYGLLDWLIPYLETQLASKTEMTTLLQGALTKYGTRLEILRQDPMNDLNHSPHSADLIEILGYWTAYNRTVIAGNVTSQGFLARLKPFIGKLSVIGALEAQSDKITVEGSKADEAFELISTTLRTWNASLLQTKPNPK